MSMQFLISDTEPSAIYERAALYISGKCGICNLEEGDIYWPNPTSRWAHTKCLAMISPAESNLTMTINELFKGDQRKKNEAHAVAVNAVQSKCNPDSISVYAAKNGVEAVTKLFNTVGVEAAQNLAALVKEKTHQDLKITKMMIALASQCETYADFIPAKL